MKPFIFLTDEGFTYSGNEGAIEPDVENLQVLGFAKGKDEKDALSNLLSENPHISDMFSSAIAIEVKGKQKHLEIQK